MGFFLLHSAVIFLWPGTINDNLSTQKMLGGTRKFINSLSSSIMLGLYIVAVVILDE